MAGCGAAAEALVAMGDPRAVERLLRVLEEAMSAAQQAAATALRSIEDLGGAENVLEALHNWHVQQEARLRLPTVLLGRSGDGEEGEEERTAPRLPSLVVLGDQENVMR